MTENGAQARRCATGAWRVNKQQHRTPVCPFQTPLRNAHGTDACSHSGSSIAHRATRRCTLRAVLVRRTRHLLYRREHNLRTPASYLFRVPYPKRRI